MVTFAVPYRRGVGTIHLDFQERVLAPSNKGIEIPEWLEQVDTDGQASPRGEAQQGEGRDGVVPPPLSPRQTSSMLPEISSPRFTSLIPGSFSVDTPFTHDTSDAPGDISLEDVQSDHEKDSIQTSFHPSNELATSSSSSTWETVSYAPELDGSNSSLKRPRETPDTETGSAKCTRRIGAYTVEERKDKIDRFRAKRPLRNYKSSIRYPHRQVLSAMRQRSQGRFTNNDVQTD